MRPMRLRTWLLVLLLTALGVASSAATSPAVSTQPPRGATSAIAAHPAASELGEDGDTAPLFSLAALSCPSERGPVKEGSDADRYRVSTSVSYTTVYYLRTRPKPSTYPYNNRVTATEFHTWQVTAYLTQYKLETDGDIHMVLKDSAGRSMISEIPYSSCVPTTSRWKSAIASARSAFAAHYAPTATWHYVHRLVDVRGLGFMDVLHGQTGVAPNGVELHPVIYMHFH